MEGGREAGEGSLSVAWEPRYPGRLPPRPPAACPAGACVSYMQHLLREVCADSPAPRHRLFLAAVTVHYSHENKLLSLPRPSLGHHTRGQGCRGPWAPALIMHCLWSWVTAKAVRGTGTPPPVVLREARSLNQPGLEGREVGTGVWDPVAFPWVPGMSTFGWAPGLCFANRL